MSNEQVPFDKYVNLANNLWLASVKYNLGFLQLFAGKVGQQKFEDVSEQWLIAESFFKVANHLMAEPSNLATYMMEWFKDYMTVYGNAVEHLLQNKAYDDKPDADPRFSDESWQKVPLFHFLKESHALTQERVLRILDKAEVDDPKDKHKVMFYSKQIIDALSPSNFMLMNPSVIRATVESDGENILHGADNFLNDVARSPNHFSIATTDFKAFAVGENLACTPGYVVYQNDLIQLIQYKPLVQKVHQIPLIIMPAWINKYYILDLQAKNSYVKWILEQGYTVFMISWVNPDSRHEHKQFADYMNEGPLAAIDFVLKLTKQPKVNMVGYCLGGTLLAATMAYLSAQKKDIVNAITFLTTLVDYADAGDLSVFIDEEQLQLLESRMKEDGYLKASDIATTFNMLRSNDMIWSFYVNNYLMGKDPFAFDILYWNSDSTRLPATVHSYYLRNMYQSNLLKVKGGITLNDVAIDLSLIQQPTYILAAKSDHIVPWKSAYQSTKLYGADCRFVLSDSGHVAGVVNHPSRQKYCYWVHGEPNVSYKQLTAENWMVSAAQLPGSWWIDWAEWLKSRSGALIDAISPIVEDAIELAPGSYVKQKAVD